MNIKKPMKRSSLIVLGVTLILLILALLGYLLIYNKTPAHPPPSLYIPPKLTPVPLKEVSMYNQLTPQRQELRKILENQFARFALNGISKEQLEAVAAAPDKVRDTFCAMHIQIVNQKIYYKKKLAGHRERIVLNALHKLVNTYNVKNVDLVIFIGDNMVITNDKKWDTLFQSIPAFHSSIDLNSKAEKNLIMMPDIHMLSLDGWNKLYKDIKDSSALAPWENKINKIYWRGSTTGGVYQTEDRIYNIKNYSKLPRISLVMMSLSFPDKIDARFTAYYQFDHSQSSQDLFKVLTILFEDSPKVPEVEHLPYKYLASIDGNTAAWVRPLWIMASNSVLLFQFRYVQWFSAAIKPWVHYVPLDYDISDIFQKLEWLRTHDAEAKKISENANKFIEAVMLPEHILEDFAFLLNEYASIQKFELTTPTLPLCGS